MSFLNGLRDLPKHPKRCPRAAHERSGAPRESPKSLPKPTPESSEGTLGRPKGLLGWFWEPRSLILEPPGLVLALFGTKILDLASRIQDLGARI